MKTSATREKITQKLRSMPVFSDASDEELREFGQMVSFRRHPKGSFIVNQSETASAMYLLVSGRVKVSVVSPGGKELALEYLDAPAHFGEMSLMDSDPGSADVVAMTDIEVFALDGKNLSAAIGLRPQLALSLIATLSRRLRNTITRLEEMAFRDATHRVMRVVLNMATAGYETRGVPVIQGLTHYDIATLAGTSRETASRVISSLAKEGVVATKGRKIVVDLIRIRERMDSR